MVREYEDVASPGCPGAGPPKLSAMAFWADGDADADGCGFGREERKSEKGGEKRETAGGSERGVGRAVLQGGGGRRPS